MSMTAQQYNDCMSNCERTPAKYVNPCSKYCDDGAGGQMCNRLPIAERSACKKACTSACAAAAGGGGGRRENYSGSKLKKLKVDLYHSRYCGWCKKSIEMLKKSGELKNVTLKDVSKPEISAEMKLKKIEGKGVPAYHSNETGKNSIGHSKSVKELVAKLS